MNRGDPVAPPSPDVTGGVRRAAAAFRSRGFRWWFSSQVLSASGNGTQAVGQGWLIVQLGGGGLALGLITGALFLPTLLGGAHAGALVDRTDRRKLLIVTQVLLATLGAALLVLTLLDAARLWNIFLISLLTGCVSAIDGPARQVFVLEIVGADRAGSAISLNEIVVNASRVVGPAVGGALIGLAGVAACFAVNAASFLFPLAVLIAMRNSVGPPGPTAREPGSAAAGLRYAWRQPVIRVLLPMAATAGMVFSLSITMPLMATRVFHVDGGVYGLMLAMFGVGAIPGAVAAAAGTPHPNGRSVALLGLATGVCAFAMAAAPNAGLMFPILFLVGFISIWFVARANTLALLTAEPLMRGRVMGVWSMFLPGANPITGLVLGAIAAGLGPRSSLAFAGLCCVLTAGLAYTTLLRSRAPHVAPTTSAPAADTAAQQV